MVVTPFYQVAHHQANIGHFNGPGSVSQSAEYVARGPHWVLIAADPR